MSDVAVTPRLISFVCPIVGSYFALFLSTLKYFGGISIHEPFSSISNLSYILGSITLLILPFFTSRENPPEVAICELLLLLLGTGSLLFHINGSVSNSWEGNIDRTFTFVPLGYLAVITLGGIISAYIGRPIRSNSIVRISLSIVSGIFLILIVLLQKKIDLLVFFLCTGIPLFIGNFYINIALSKSNITTVRCAFGIFITQIFLLTSSYILVSLAGSAVPNDVQYDFCHGSWHILTSIVITNAIVTIYCAYTQYDEISCLYLWHILFCKWVLGITMLILGLAKTSATVWITTLCIVQMIISVIVIFPILNTFKRERLFIHIT